MEKAGVKSVVGGGDVLSDTMGLQRMKKRAATNGRGCIAFGN
jgi:hypothetical protein